MSPLRGWRIAGQPQFLNGHVNCVAAVNCCTNDAAHPKNRYSKTHASGHKMTQNQKLSANAGNAENCYFGVWPHWKIGD